MSFLPIPGFPGYEINPVGEVRSLPKRSWNGKVYFTTKDRILTAGVSGVGYRMVCLSTERGAQRVYLHRLLALTFIPNPEGKRTVNHKDGDKLNNSLENLEWYTSSENITHALRTGLRIPKGMPGTSNHRCKITESDVRAIRNFRGSESLSTTGKRFGLSTSQVWSIQNNKSWNHI